MKSTPGSVYDKKGRPIYPGDLLRSFHFRGARRKVYYLYHVAVWSEKWQTMEMVPTCYLEPSKPDTGGRCWLTQDAVDREQTEIIHGSGPGDLLSYEDRPRVFRPAEGVRQ